MHRTQEMILGYTRAGHAVLLPTHRSLDHETLVHWTRGDHADAAHILREHSEREQDPEIHSWCRQAARAHRELSKSTKKRVNIRGAAEISIKVRGPR